MFTKSQESMFMITVILHSDKSRKMLNTKNKGLKAKTTTKTLVLATIIKCAICADISLFS